MKKLIFLGGEDVSARIEISKKFIDLGYKIEIVGTQAPSIFEKNGIAYSKYSLNREFNILNDIKTILELRAFLKKQENGTVVHAFDTKPTLYLPISAFGLKNVNIVRTITGMGRIFTEDSLKNKVLRFIYNTIQKFVNFRVDFTIFQNDDDYNYFIEHSLVQKEKSEVVKSSGLDINKFTSIVDDKDIATLQDELNLDTTQKTIILVSRMVKQKGILNYLEAAKLCHEKGFNYNFLLVGQLDTDGSISKEEIESYSKYVKYLGRREDVKNLLTISDIFVLPTYYREGVPRVLLEASALGLALIATDMPGCRDVVEDEYNGKLVKIKNSQDLANKIMEVANSDKLETYAKNAKEKVKEFDLSIVVDKYDEVYKSLL